MKRALIFDFDGTLAETSELLSHTIGETIRRYADPSMRDFEVLKFYGPTETGIIKKLVPSEKCDEAISFFYRFYDSYQREMDLRPLDGILSLLSDWRKRTRLFILTGRSERTLDLSLSHFKWPSDLFEDIICGGEEGAIKTRNVVYLCEKHELALDDVLYIGDSLSDIKQMRDADVDIVSAGYYHSDDYVKELEKNNPGMVARDVEELRDLIEPMI